MSHSRAGATESRALPPSHRGLGALGYLVAAGLLLVAFLLLNSTTTVEASVVPPDAGQDAAATETEIVCLSVLSGGPSGQLTDVEDGQVEEERVDDQSDVLARCSRQRDQATGRALIVGTAGGLVAMAVTGLLGRAAQRRRLTAA